MFRDIRAITFDAYGTLVHLFDPYERLVRGLEGKGFHVPLDIATRAFHQEMAYYTTHHLEASHPQALEHLRRRCAGVLFEALAMEGYPCPLSLDEQFQVLVGTIQFQLFEEVAPILAWCVSRGVPTGVISNWDCSLPQTLEGLLPHHAFDCLMVSAIEGVDKSGPALFRRAAQRLHVEPDQVLHIGDHPFQDCAAARKAGFKALFLDRLEAFEEADCTTIPTLNPIPRFLPDLRFNTRE